jgi:hypothetical protein
MAIFEPQQEGSNLDQIQKYFVWWDQYQGFETPLFWLNVFFSKSRSTLLKIISDFKFQLEKSDALEGHVQTCHVLVIGNPFNLFYNKI